MANFHNNINTALFFCFFLSAIITTTLASSSANDLVLDVDGQPLVNGGQYHILPVKRGWGGGLELAKTGKETCALAVVQSRSEGSSGLPATLASPLLLEYIPEGLPLTIAFPDAPKCAPAPEWDVVEESPSIGQSVKVGGDRRFVGPFRIKAYKKDYKLVYCSDSDAKCEDLGIIIDEENNRRVVVGDGKLLVVQFKKAFRNSSGTSFVC